MGIREKSVPLHHPKVGIADIKSTHATSEENNIINI